MNNSPLRNLLPLRPPFYPIGEIDRICVRELHATALYPDKPSAIRIDRFIEKRFKVVPRYEPLANGILGFTTFGRNGVQEIVIDSSLEEAATSVSERRIRTTLAHEAGHALLHAYLFETTGQCELFPDGSESLPRVLCRELTGETRAGKYNGEWWEVQANRAIGGFLLPTALVQEALKSFVTNSGSFCGDELKRHRRAEAINHLSEVFEVNGVVARIRLDALYPDDVSEQGTL